MSKLIHPVMLEITTIETGLVKTTGPYEKTLLDNWVEHARNQSGEEVFTWKIQEISNVP